MKVALLTMFSEIDSTYLLVNVVMNHIKMFLDNDIDVKLIVSLECMETEKVGIFSDKRIEWVYIDNKMNDDFIKLIDYSNQNGDIHNTFYEEARFFSEKFFMNLSDVKFCFMYNIMCQGINLVYNLAIRLAQVKLPYIKFVAYTNNSPIGRPSKLIYPFSLRFETMENTIFAYPYHSGISALSEQFGIPEGNCRIIYNTQAIEENMSKPVKEIIEKTNLYNSDIVVVYPAKLLWTKKFEKISSLCGVIKENQEKSIRIIFCDFESGNKESEDYKKLIRDTGIKYGLEDSDMLFTSDIGYRNGIKKQSVQELFKLSNLFICPSFTENFGMVVLEAASSGNFLVLNRSVPALEEIGKSLNSYFMSWNGRNYGFTTIERYRPSELEYYKEHSKKIVTLMREDSTNVAKTMSRKKYNQYWVWRNQVKPILENH